MNCVGDELLDDQKKQETLKAICDAFPKEIKKLAGMVRAWTIAKVGILQSATGGSQELIDTAITAGSGAVGTTLVAVLSRNTARTMKDLCLLKPNT
eukprot:g18250.t1